MIGITPRDLGEHGLDAALDRAEGTEGLDRLVAVGEALWWLAALDAFHCVSQDAYVAQRRADPEGHTTGALVWARNRIGHGLATVLDLVEDPLTWDGEALTWDGEPLVCSTERWVPLETLLAMTPAPDPERSEDRRDDWYREHVAGWAVLAPLSEARSFLHRVDRT